MSLTVVIPSRTSSNLIPCLEAVRRNEPEAQIIVVDDGIVNRPTAQGIAYVEGMKPFGFPRNCNVGIKASNNGGVVLLNDDALLHSKGGFTLLQKEAEQHPEFGILSSTTNVAGNSQQYPKGVGLREAERTVAFVCVYIPRRTIDAVGLMDERFGGLTPDGKRIYGWCDNDYCRRVRQAGMKIGIHDGCFVDHGSLRSSFRGDPHASADISEGRKLYLAKWGDTN